MLEAKNISFSYSDKIVIDNVSFSIPQGHHVSVIGESGCGKSTLLKLIYGIHDLDEGNLSYEGQPILGPKFNLIPGEDYIKYLAQDFGLMPYITVAENVGKFLSNIYKDKKKQRVDELLEMVEMAEFANIKPQHLSGGQQQRVALAKVLALEPEVLLLDEPFSQVDAFRTNNLRRNLFRYLKEKDITCLVATHDSSDVLSFSDETFVMRDGKIIESGTPERVYNTPKNKYVASLFGDVNEIPESYLKPSGDKNKIVLVYPRQLKLAENNPFQVTVKQSYFKGSHYLVEANYAGGILFFEHVSALANGTLTSLVY